MQIKVRLFWDGKEVQPSDLIIKNKTVDRIINATVDKKLKEQAICNEKKSES